MTRTYRTEAQRDAFAHDYENNGSEQAVRKHAPLAAFRSLRVAAVGSIKQQLERAGFLPGRVVAMRRGKQTFMVQEAVCAE